MKFLSARRLRRKTQKKSATTCSLVYDLIATTARAHKYKDPVKNVVCCLYVFLYAFCQKYVFCMFVEMAGINVCFMYVL